MGQEISNLTACCEPETTLAAATPEIQMKKVSKAAFKATGGKAEIQSAMRMSRSKLVMERQAAGFKTLQSHSTSPGTSEQAPSLVSPRKSATSSIAFTSNLMSPTRRRPLSGGGGGSPPTSSRSIWSAREVNGMANQRSVSPEKGASDVHEQSGGDENGGEVTRKLRVVNGLVYDVESGVIIGEDEAAKLAPLAAAEARKQDNGAGSQGHGGGAGGEGGAEREGGGVYAGSRTHLEHPIFSGALRISSSGSKSQGPNSGGLSLPLHLVHREVSNEPRVMEKAPSGIESEEAAVLLEARERALELGKKPGSQERGVDASPRQGIAQENMSPRRMASPRMASPRVLAHKFSKSQLASS